MKRKMLLFMICCGLIFYFSPVFYVKANEVGQLVDVEYLEDGTYFETVLEEIPLTSRSSTKSGSKTVNYKNGKGKILWSVTVHGKFAYNGKIAKCTSATVSTTCPSKTWKMVSSSAKKSGANAIGTATAKQYVDGVFSQSKTKTVTLHCSASGKLS
ncbi:MAG TPA: hypothetical protein H9880_09935 [Candidatus Anaerobutyricum avicola]|nr:hypothetical protein [Candidatus Anaerobutyricum avicola]